jgi:cobalt-zinc-cadmium efflux system membrane fusion protein
MSPFTTTRRDAPVVRRSLEGELPQAALNPVRSSNWGRRSLSTVAVVAMLGGLAYFGHATDWKLLAFSSLIGGDVAPVDDWCAEHNVAESKCIECQAGLVPSVSQYGWCKLHGVAECPLEHPDVAQLATPPIITAVDLEQAERGLALLPRMENNRRCKSYQRRIQFASAAALEKAGVDIAVVGRRPIVEVVVANGEVEFDETRLAHLSSRVAGTVWRVEKQVGELVKTGDVLALVDSSEIGRSKGELLQALAQVRLKQTNADRLRPLARDASIAERTYREADAALQEAQIRLLTATQALANLGLPVNAEEFAGMRLDEISRRIQFVGLPDPWASSLVGVTTSNLYPLRASLDGTVVERNVVAGEVIDNTKPLFTVTDIDHLWLTLAVRQDDARYVSLGQPVLFHPSDNKGSEEIKGTVSWISAAADSVTRTVQVRVDLPNSLKFFHVREVRTGVKQGEMTEILVGLLPGEVIAAKNSVVLEAQLLKSNLGAGCGCADGQ